MNVVWFKKQPIYMFNVLRRQKQNQDIRIFYSYARKHNNVVTKTESDTPGVITTKLYMEL